MFVIIIKNDKDVCCSDLFALIINLLTWFWIPGEINALCCFYADSARICARLIWCRGDSSPTRELSQCYSSEGPSLSKCGTEVSSPPYVPPSPTKFIQLPYLPFDNNANLNLHRYHAHVYTNGTICDLTNQPRETEVCFLVKAAFMYLTVAWFDEFLDKLCVNILAIFYWAFLDGLLLSYGGFITSFSSLSLFNLLSTLWYCSDFLVYYAYVGSINYLSLENSDSRRLYSSWPWDWYLLEQVRFVCSETGRALINSIKEAPTCKYTLVFHAPMLCKHP